MLPSPHSSSARFLTRAILTLQCHFLRGDGSGYQISNYQHTLLPLFCLLLFLSQYLFLVFISIILYTVLIFILILFQQKRKLFEGQDFCLLYSSLQTYAQSSAWYIVCVQWVALELINFQGFRRGKGGFRTCSLHCCCCSRYALRSSRYATIYYPA